MAWDKGFNFRATDSYVTDGADETYVRGNTDAYPTTRNGVTFGWEDSIGGAIDRASGNDRRLAGINYTSTTNHRFRVDLPATGDYTVALAMGDAASSQEAKWAWKDDTTTLGSISHNGTTAANYFYDPTDTEYTNLTWPGSNTAVQYTFATTIFRVQTNGTLFVNPTIAHVFLSQVASVGNRRRRVLICGAVP